MCQHAINYQFPVFMNTINFKQLILLTNRSCVLPFTTWVLLEYMCTDLDSRIVCRRTTRVRNIYLDMYVIKLFITTCYNKINKLTVKADMNIAKMMILEEISNSRHRNLKAKPKCSIFWTSCLDIRSALWYATTLHAREIIELIIDAIVTPTTNIL